MIPSSAKGGFPQKNPVGILPDGGRAGRTFSRNTDWQVVDASVSSAVKAEEPLRELIQKGVGQKLIVKDPFRWQGKPVVSFGFCEKKWSIVPIGHFELDSTGI